MLSTRERLVHHAVEAERYFPEERTVGIFLQGSQNYGLDTMYSDVDTKLIIVPSFKDIAMNHKPVSTTHVRDNDEHIDFKDIRLYMDTFKKQNLNFLEILFTEYKIVYPMYVQEWNRLVAERENIAHMNPYRAIKSMKGIAMEKYHAMEHPYPTKLHLIEQYGYDGKQVHHLLRVEDYMRRYIAGESYESCLRPTHGKRPRMMEYKMHEVPLHIAREEAAESLARVVEMADAFCAKVPEGEDPAMTNLLADVQYNIMKIAISEELKKGD